MKKTLKSTLFWTAAIAALLVFACKPNERPLVLATYTYSTNDRIDNLRLLAKDLEEALGRPVEIRSYPDVASFIDGIRADEVDVALINTLGYLLLALDNERMVPVANLKIKEDAVDNYKTVLLTREDIDIERLESLQENAGDLSMLFVNKGSTSGNLVPRLLLSSLGIESPESQFREVSYGGDHAATFEKLRSGKTDICAIGSNEYFGQIQADSSLSDTIRVLWISEEIPLGPVLLNKRLSGPDQEKITGLILQLHLRNPEALESIKEAWSEAKQAEKFQPVTDRYYDDFRMVNGNSTDLANILTMFVR